MLPNDLLYIVLSFKNNYKNVTVTNIFVTYETNHYKYM